MSRSEWAALIVVLVLGAALRLGWVAVRHGGAPDVLTYPDEYAYQLAGHSLAVGQGLVDEFGYRATYMPAYPALIAIFERLGLSMLVFRMAQAILAALVGPATFLLAREWIQKGGRVYCPGDTKVPNPANRGAVWVVPTLAGVAAALDPFLVFFSGLLLTEALFAVALVATWWLVVRVGCGEEAPSVPVLLAMSLGVLVCVMLRPSSTILIVLVPAAILIGRGLSAGSILAAGLTVALVLAGLSPWAARNARVLGEWRWTTTRGGISLYDGLQTGAGGGSDLARTKRDPNAQGMSELQWDRYWQDRAIQVLRESPTAEIKLAGRKFLRTWNIVPNEPEHRRGKSALISAGWMVVALVTAAIGFWQTRKAVRGWLILLAPVVAFTLLHMVFVGSVRYRIPLMPLVFVLSAVGVARIAFGWKTSAMPLGAAGDHREEPRA